ncbi:MAG: hypothetical protein ACQKBT_01510, partial [Puniceicoccales bacterium]
MRIIFGIFEKDGEVKPVSLGLYPEFKLSGAMNQDYRTQVGEVSFEHAGKVPGIELGHRIDNDGEGFVIAARIPRESIPGMTKPFNGELRPMGNFSANLGGHNKFWWAD